MNKQQKTDSYYFGRAIIRLMIKNKSLSLNRPGGEIEFARLRDKYINHLDEHRH